MNDIIDSLTCSDDIKEELQCILAMHEEELTSLKEINEGENKYISVEPFTGGDESIRFVKLHMRIDLKNYPNAIPEFNVLQSRFLQDSDLKVILNSFKEISTELLNNSFLMDVIEKGFELITEFNSKGSCYICFSTYNEDSLNLMYRSECFHSFHNNCILKWRDINIDKSKNSDSSKSTIDSIKREVSEKENQVNSISKLINDDENLIKEIERQIDAVQKGIDGYNSNNYEGADEGEIKKMNKKIKELKEKKKSMEDHKITMEKRLKNVEIQLEETKMNSKYKEKYVGVIETIPCPVCRHSLPISSFEDINISSLASADDDAGSEMDSLSDPIVIEYLNNLKSKFDKVYKKQQQKGGLIEDNL